MKNKFDAVEHPSFKQSMLCSLLMYVFIATLTHGGLSHLQELNYSFHEISDPLVQVNHCVMLWHPVLLEEAGVKQIVENIW